MRLVFVTIISFVLLSSCKEKNNEYAPINSGSKAHQIKVKEVLQTGTYTYLFVNENKEDYWMAVSKADIKVDDHLYYNKALEMINFGFKIRSKKSTILPFLGINNAFDTKYNDNIRINAFGGRYYEPAPGINIFGGIRVEI